jgi:SAM-dependent methyltransferase
VTTSQFYHRGFYSGYRDASLSSARAIIDVVLRHIRPPASVIDVGCGIGTWLKVWEELGAEIRGIDGDYVRREQLLIDPEKFTPMELRAPVSPGGQFDLAQSMEVAEHLDESHSDGFVDFLCSLSPVVLFGAAIPYQGGDHHVNEQWPEYWAEKFRQKGYVCADVIREEVWNDPRCAYYYAQNSFLYIREDHLPNYPRLQQAASGTDIRCLARVHPRKWMSQIEGTPRLEYLLGKLPSSLKDFVLRAFRKLKRMAFGD